MMPHAVLSGASFPISFPAGATVESGIGAWPDLPEGQHWAVLALWEANRPSLCPQRKDHHAQTQAHWTRSLSHRSFGLPTHDRGQTPKEWISRLTAPFGEGREVFFSCSWPPLSRARIRPPFENNSRPIPFV